MINGDYIQVKAPEDFLGKKYCKKYCLEHHLIYWINYGVVPNENEVIHHINGNKHDNRIENLQLLSKKEHSSLHSSQKEKRFVELKCPFCDKIFVKSKRKTFLQKSSQQYTCCSKEWAHKFNSIKGEKRKEKIKNNFIREFTSV